MKSFQLVAFFVALVSCFAGCRENMAPNPLAPSEPPPSFQTYIQYMDGGLRVVFKPSTDLTISRVIIAKPGKASSDTVNSFDPSRIFAKDQVYYVNGYIADDYGTEGEYWKFVFTGNTDPTGTPYTCSTEWGVP